MPSASSSAIVRSSTSGETTAIMPMPRFQVPSVSASAMRPRSASCWNTGVGVQVDRSTSTHEPAGSTRARFAAMPPPVTWLNAWMPST